MTAKRWTDRFSLHGKVALITGATSGIGFEAAKVLADAGADIVGVGGLGGDQQDVAAAVRALGRRCEAFNLDLATTSGPSAAARLGLEAFGRVDILVNNAGIARIEPLLEMTLDNWEAQFALNLRAPQLLAMALAPQMIARRAGKVINISSQAGVIALDGHGAYCASKAGLNLLTKVMALEWGKHNIQANAICPTVILTPLGEKVWGQPEKGGPMLAKIPLGRFGQPIEVADAILYLASPAADLITGETLMLDGGYTAV